MAGNMVCTRLSVVTTIIHDLILYKHNKPAARREGQRNLLSGAV